MDSFNAGYIPWVNYLARPRGYKTFLCSTQLSMKFQLLIKIEIPKNEDFSLLNALRWCIYPADNIYEQDEFQTLLN